MQQVGNRGDNPCASGFGVCNSLHACIDWQDAEYMRSRMLISHEEPKFIFIHIQKTGGVSISNLLRRYIPTTTPGRGRRHISARRALKQVENPDDYFKFAFVRDPWDRLVSWYTMIDEARRGVAEPRALRRIKKNNLFKYVLRCGPTFDEFVKNCTEKQWMGNCYYSFTFNQLRYLTDKNGEVLVDYIGRFENFAQDISHVFDMLGLEASQLEIPHENRSAHSHYSEMYTPETREIVRKRFRRDIEFFGYEFETAPRQVVR
jgi:Sulfotransferase family